MTKKKMARIISELFNGFLTMILTPIFALSVSNIQTITKVILFTTFLIVSTIPYFVLKAMGKITDYEFSKREERPPFFVIISVLFGVLFLVSKFLGDEIFATVSLALFLSTTIMTIITFFWKISGHTIYATLLFATLIYLFPNLTLLPLIFFVLPLIGWSRVVLKKHTTTQVIAGTLLSLIISVLIYWI